MKRGRIGELFGLLCVLFVLVCVGVVHYNTYRQPGAAFQELESATISVLTSRGGGRDSTRSLHFELDALEARLAALTGEE